MEKKYFINLFLFLLCLFFLPSCNLALSCQPTMTNVALFLDNVTLEEVNGLTIPPNKKGVFLVAGTNSLKISAKKNILSNSSIKKSLTFRANKEYRLSFSPEEQLFCLKEIDKISKIVIDEINSYCFNK